MANVMRIGGGSGAKPLLPSGYTQLSHIESTGTQYIDAGFVPNQNTKVVIDFQAKNTDCAIFGSRIDYNNSAFTLYWSSTNAAAIEIGSNFFSLGSLVNSDRHTVGMSGTKFVIDGTTTQTYSTTTFSPTANMRLFHSGGADSLGKMIGKIYSCQIYDNDTLIRDFVPCKNVSGTVGLYDTANGVFYGNAGTGTFIGGAELNNGNNLVVEVDDGATVTASNGGKSVSAVSKNGYAVLVLPKAGLWNLVAELNGQTTGDTVEIVDEYPVEFDFSGLPLNSLPEGALVKLNENGSGVNFYLAKHDYESGLNGVGRELLARSVYYSKILWNPQSNRKSTYENSNIDTWLNGTYKEMLDVAVQRLIGTTDFYYTVGGGSTTKTTLSRGVFALSLAELGKTHSNANAEGTTLPIASTLVAQNGSGEQWTRTPLTNSEINAFCVAYNGNVVGYTVSSSLGVVPAFTLPATALVNPTPNADGSYTLMI